MQRGVHFDPLRLPLLGGCTSSSSSARVCVLSGRESTYVRVLGVVFTPVCVVLRCAVCIYYAAAAAAAGSSVVRVLAPSRDVICRAWSSLWRVLLPYGGSGGGGGAVESSVASKRRVRWGLVSLFYKSSLRLNVGNIHHVPLLRDTHKSPKSKQASEAKRAVSV